MNDRVPYEVHVQERPHVVAIRLFDSPSFDAHVVECNYLRAFGLHSTTCASNDGESKRRMATTCGLSCTCTSYGTRSFIAVLPVNRSSRRANPSAYRRGNALSAVIRSISNCWQNSRVCCVGSKRRSKPQNSAHAG